MNAYISNKQGYVVNVYAPDDFGRAGGNPSWWRWFPVLKTDCQTDAIEFRNAILKGRVSESRLKLLARQYDGTVKRITSWSSYSGEPNFKRVNNND